MPADEKELPVSKPAGGWVSLLAVYLIWGSTYFAVRIVVGSGDVAPVHLQFARSVAAAVLLGLITLALRRRSRRERVPARYVAMAGLSGVLMWATGNGFATYAAANASSSFIVMAMGTIPLWTVLIKALLDRRLPTRREVLALVVGFVGLALVMAPGLTREEIINPEHAVGTILLLIGGGATWAAGTSIQRRMAPHFSIPGLTTVQFSAAMLVLLVPALMFPAPDVVAIQASQWAAFTFLVVIGSAVSLAAYNIVVRTFRPAIASSFAYVNPVVGVLLGAIFLREVVAPVSVVGLLVVLAAVGAILAHPEDRQRK